MGALATWPGGFQIGGGIDESNAARWLDAGASHVIVTSALFDKAGKFQEQILRSLSQRIGKHKLVIDLSCRPRPAGADDARQCRARALSPSRSVVREREALPHDPAPTRRDCRSLEEQNSIDGESTLVLLVNCGSLGPLVEALYDARIATKQHC